MLWALLRMRFQAPQAKCFKEPFFVLGEPLEHFFWIKVLNTTDKLPGKILYPGSIVDELLAHSAEELLERHSLF